MFTGGLSNLTRAGSQGLLRGSKPQVPALDLNGNAPPPFVNRFASFELQFSAFQHWLARLRPREDKYFDLS